MDIKNRHPLNAINGYESLSMLEALIPFVEYPLKLPLALFIKFNEIKLIVQNFRSIETLTRLGLHNVNSDPMDMVCALTGISPDMLKMLFSMMDNGGNPMSSDIINTLAGFSGGNSSHTASTNSDFSGNSYTDTDSCGMNFSGMDFSKLANLFQSMQTGSGNDSNSTSTPDTPTGEHQNFASSNHSDHFDENLQSILAKYDLQQAEAFDTHSKDMSSVETDSSYQDTNFMSEEYDNINV